jgi:hypothetical protein
MMWCLWRESLYIARVQLLYFHSDFPISGASN